MTDRKVIEAITSHENNYTWLRLFLSASIIYYHAFGLTFQTGYVDHVTQWLQPVTTVGGLAVQSFFFLSGLFVAQSYFRDPNFLHFAIKRSLRIWPGLFVCLLATTVLAVLLSRPKDGYHYLLFGDIYSYILKTSVFNFKWTIDGIYSDNKSAVLNGSIHTLPLEAKMYVLLGLVGLLGLARTRRRLGAAGVVLMILCFVPSTLDKLPLRLFSAEYARTAACMFIAGMIVFGTAHRIVPRLWQGVVLLLITVVAQGQWHIVSFYGVVCWALLYLGQSPLLAKLGRPRQDLSYGIYLYGWPSQQLVMSLFPNLNPYGLMVLALTVASMFALASWRLIEKPAMKMGNELSAQRPGPHSMPILTNNSKRLAVLLGASVLACLAMFGVTQRMDFQPETRMKAAIESFGPTDSVAGKAINLQPDGSSAIWIKTTEPVSNGTVVVFAGTRLETTVYSDVVTAKIPDALLAAAGDFQIYLEHRDTHQTERSVSVVMHLKD